MQRLQLRDGRQLTYAFFGVPLDAATSAATSAAAGAAVASDATEPAIPAPTGSMAIPSSPPTSPRPPVVLTFHGFGCSRLEAALLHDHALHHGLTLLAVDRPGAGRSSFNPQQSVHSMAQDAEQLLDALGLGTVAVMGTSGGAPFASACAALLPERVAALLLVCPLMPVAGREECLLPGTSSSTLRLIHNARHRPKVLRAALHALRLIQRVPHGTLLLRMTGFAPVDIRVQRELPCQAALLRKATREGLAQGVSGAVRDMQIFYRDTPLPDAFLAAIRCPAVIWQGALDTTTPVSMARCYADAIPGAVLRLLEGEGHLSLLFRHTRDIMGSLKAVMMAAGQRAGQGAHSGAGRAASA